MQQTTRYTQRVAHIPLYSPAAIPVIRPKHLVTNALRSFTHHWLHTKSTLSVYRPPLVQRKVGPLFTNHQVLSTRRGQQRDQRVNGLPASPLGPAKPRPRSRQVNSLLRGPLLLVVSNAAMRLPRTRRHAPSPPRSPAFTRGDIRRLSVTLLIALPHLPSSLTPHIQGPIINTTTLPSPHYLATSTALLVQFTHHKPILTSPAPCLHQAITTLSQPHPKLTSR